jgi:multidrug efflux pump subunit AcrA (membrane-fusion protein)
MFARVKLEVGMIRDVLAVPTAALFDRDEQKRTATVYKVVKHKVSAVKLNIGPSDDTHTLVGKGLSSGDLVVVQTAGDLTNGQDVRDQPAPSPTAEP